MHKQQALYGMPVTTSLTEYITTSLLITHADTTFYTQNYSKNYHLY